jgi:type IV secretory pathway TraG/TraD family ATPase VirD4
MNPGTLVLVIAMVAMAIAARFLLTEPETLWVAVPALLTAAWCGYSGIAAVIRQTSGAVLRFAGMTWTRDQCATHFLITGPPGSGKTARAIVPILHGFRQSMPGTGILAIDSKGALWQPVSRIAEALGQHNDLRLIRVRPTTPEGAEWQAPLRLNLLGDRSVPWSTYAKLIIDTATSSGQKGGQSFFKETSRDLMTHAMRSLDLCQLPVTLENVHHVCCTAAGTEELVAELRKAKDPAAMEERLFFKDFAAQPNEQKGGIISSAANYLRPYTHPDLVEVFSSLEPNFSLSELDAGRLVCLSIPQTLQVERKYINFLCKQLFFLHAFRRFDLSDVERQRRNLLVLVLDEAQKTTLVSEDGFSDHGAVDELREAGVCVVAATQTPLSFHASFGDEKKADVFMANLRTHIHFRAADEKGAKIISDKMGGRQLKKYSGGASGGKASRNWQLVDEPWVKPQDLLNLPEGVAVVRHPETTGAPVRRKLPLTRFTRANEYRMDEMA